MSKTIPYLLIYRIIFFIGTISYSCITFGMNPKQDLLNRLTHLKQQASSIYIAHHQQVTQYGKSELTYCMYQKYCAVMHQCRDLEIKLYFIDLFMQPSEYSRALPVHSLEEKTTLKKDNAYELSEQDYNLNWLDNETPYSIPTNTTTLSHLVPSPNEKKDQHTEQLRLNLTQQLAQKKSMFQQFLYDLHRNQQRIHTNQCPCYDCKKSRHAVKIIPAGLERIAKDIAELKKELSALT